MKNWIYVFAAIGFLACKKDPPVEPEVPEKYENGVVVLNEGLFEQNNSSLSFYSNGQAYQLVFKSENNRGLGDTANDFESYSWGGKEYIIIAVDVSSQVEIIERNTLKSVAQIPLFDGSNAREPRRVVVYGDHAFVCNYDGTVAVINLSTYAVVTILEVGANPDGMVMVGEQLFVSNSGGLNFPVYDSTITVINMNSKSVIATFETRINSNQMVVDGENEIYLVSNGNYDDIPRALLRIDAVNRTVIETMEMPVSSLSLLDDWLYFYDGEEQVIKRLNTLTEVIDSDVVLDVAGFETFYGFHIDATNQQIYCVDANGYVNSSTIAVYSLSGAFLYDFTAGLNATDLIFNY